MLTITFVSLVLAAASGFIAWRSIRREHLRADARIASLAAVIDAERPLHRLVSRDPGFEDVLEFQSEVPVNAPALDTIGVHPSARRRLLTMGIGAAAVVAVVVLIAMTGDRYDPPTQPIIAPHAESLELLSLRATRDGSTIAITGFVRSRTEEPLTTVTAVVSAIDAKGRPVGRGSTPLATILPRRESRFVVTVPNVSEAARYRVSFRSATGVIRHLDRRVEKASGVS